MLKDEFNYYTAEQDRIVDGHIGDYVVIKDQTVQGYYKDQWDAFAATRNYDLGTFMVKQCKHRGEDIMNFYNTQVRFG